MLKVEIRVNGKVFCSCTTNDLTLQASALVDETPAVASAPVKRPIGRPRKVKP